MDARIPDSYEMSFTLEGPQARRRLEQLFDRPAPKATRVAKPRNPRHLARRLTPAEARDLHRQHDAHVAALKLVDRQAVKDAHKVEMAARKERRKLLTSSAIPGEKPVPKNVREIARRLRQIATASA
jgi:hypothetical protein